MNTHQMLPEHIRASLAQYSKHQQCTCLQCGYSGLMGVHRQVRKVNRFASYSMLAGILVISIISDGLNSLLGLGIPIWLGIIFAGLWYFIDSLKDIYLACPNCNTELKMN